MMILLLTVRVWALAHPAEMTMLVGALVSLFVDRMNKYPRMQAALGVLAHAGINVPAVTRSVVRLLAGMKSGPGALAVLAFVCLTHCKNKLTPTDKTDLASYEAQQMACIAATPKDKAAIDACRAKVKAEWCAAWKARFDQEVCK